MTGKNNEIVITRVIDAPRERVFEAWTDPKQVVKWWGPYGFTTTIHEMDVRTGGVWKHTMHGPDGTDYPNHKTFLEVVKPERIVLQQEGGKPGDKGVCFKGSWTFEALGNKTKLTLRMEFPDAEERDRVNTVYRAIEGGNQTLNRLQGYMAGGCKEFIIAREFDAPRELVWKSFTEPERMKDWWGPKGAEILNGKMDFRVGGFYHYGMRYAGKDMWGKQVYLEINPPEKIVFINSFSDEKGGLTRHPMSPSWPIQMLTIITFTENAGKTTFTVQWSPINPDENERKTFEGGFDSMKGGWSGTFENLAAYLAREQAGNRK